MSMLTRRVLWLDAEITRCNHRTQRALLRAERAGLLARQGHGAEAAREVSALHAEFDAQPFPEMSVALYLAEAWLAYFRDLSPDARDKVQRAHRLAEAAGLLDQQALSAAWLAHLDYVHLDVEAMAEHAREALALAAPDHHAARSRACLVLADAFHLAQRVDWAQPWYALSRQHAQAEEDPMTLSALIHNMAWHRAMHALQATLRGSEADADPALAPQAVSEARHALASCKATDQFDQCRGVVSLPSLIQVAMAVAHSVLGDAAQALSLYEVHAPQADAQGLRPLRAMVLADMAWCCEQVGAHDKAVHYAQAATRSFDFSQHADDRALAHGRLAQLFTRWGQPRRAAQHRRQARALWAEHQALQSRVLAALQGWVCGPGGGRASELSASGWPPRVGPNPAT